MHSQRTALAGNKAPYIPYDQRTASAHNKALNIPYNQSEIEYLGYTVAPRKKIVADFNTLLIETSNTSLAHLALLYVIRGDVLDPTILIRPEIQEAISYYLRSYMILRHNTTGGLENFSTAQRIGDDSAYGTINIGSMGSPMVKYIVKADISQVGLEMECILGMKVYNLLRLAAPYWAYTYAFQKCNDNLQSPDGNDSFYWCKYSDSSIQMCMEYVEGIPYRTFLSSIKDSDRQIVVLTRILDAIGYMWQGAVMHGDLHALNIKVVTFKHPVYTKILNPNYYSIGYSYICGVDIPVILDYGFSTILQDNKLYNNTLWWKELEFNPFRDIERVLLWITQTGELFIPTTTVITKLGEFYNQVVSKMKSHNVTDFVIHGSTSYMEIPFLESTLRKEPSKAAVAYGLPISHDERYYAKALFQKRIAFASPREVLNAMDLKLTLSKPDAHELMGVVEAFNIPAYAEHLKSMASILVEREKLLTKQLSTLDLIGTLTDDEFAIYLNAFATSIFSMANNMHQLLEGIVSANMLDASLMQINHLDTTDKIMKEIDIIWNPTKLSKLMDTLVQMYRSWQGMSLALHHKEHKHTQQRHTMASALSMLKSATTNLHNYSLARTSTQTYRAIHLEWECQCQEALVTVPANQYTNAAQKVQRHSSSAQVNCVSHCKANHTFGNI